MLRKRCEEIGIETLQADADADYLIVSTVNEIAESNDNAVVLAGNDADLAVMLTSNASPNNSIFIMFETSPITLYKVKDFQSKVEVQDRPLLNVMHCLTGCDTTSACYLRAKRTGFNMLHKMTMEEKSELSTFLNTSDSLQEQKNEIARVGEKFLLKLYNAKAATTLDKLRYITYNKKLKTLKVSSTFQLATLPPTTAAAKQHAYRAYHAVQQCMGNHLDPMEWGWSMEGDNLVPSYTDKDVAPANLLKLVSCGCKHSCTKSCSCVKLGLHCSVMCSTCNGQLCKNVPANPTDDE